MGWKANDDLWNSRMQYTLDTISDCSHSGQHAWGQPLNDTKHNEKPVKMKSESSWLDVVKLKMHTRYYMRNARKKEAKKWIWTALHADVPVVLCKLARIARAKEVFVC